LRLGALLSPADRPAPQDISYGLVSKREAAALAETQERSFQHRARMRPTLWIVLAVVVCTVFAGRPRPGLVGVHLGVSVALAGVCLTIGPMAADLWPMSRPRLRVAFPVLVGASGLLLEGLQPSDLTTMPTSVSVLTAVLFLPPILGRVIAGAMTGGLLLEAWLLPGGTLSNAAGELAFCAALALMALSMRQAGQNEARAEVLLARLEDAREAEARSVVVAERTRIARDLHDVLAQSLSGLAIQLEGARQLARREQVSEQLQTVLERSGGLVKEGLEGARRAVGALRDATGPILDRLPELVERYRADHRLDAHLLVEGTPRELPPETGLALYRGVQEALTNAARYAHGSQTTVTLRYGPTHVALTVEDQGAGPSAAAPTDGPGMGLIGMRERLAQVGGTVAAGPSGEGWTVRMEVAA